MAERGQNTQIIVGAASADVVLLKTSMKPIEAQHETRRVTVGTAVSNDAAPTVNVGRNGVHPESDPTAIEPDNPHGEVLEEARPVSASMVQRGVTGPDGEWVDLTDELREIDERTKISGLTIDCTIPLSHLPKTWVRNSYFIAPTTPEASLFLGHLWCGLMPTMSAALVRFTKRTGQYFGAIIPRGHEPGSPTLVLMELEWAANMRAVPERARLDVADVSDAGRQSARDAMVALRKSATVVHELRDERAAQRSELLYAARAGNQWKAPEPTRPEAVDVLADALIAAVR